ncbi:hypothetical protein [Novosphingobium pentaromativorans]|uniref:Uncharacterized protein n=1 Tax=Novosphingobium pentaromativorans US6-1 TaxID=1088721 RepID=G6EKQ6_9SPHN|nr:hypothetical protein [Novosphingobium pentaromativorans]AIT79124.1 hypothetical protein JI59_04540 [Novosphingobium pentaromativorans US6-1]EHJ58114.1 hypothetical protein NSU_4927 [Novosphingobium pentaromativorans US6-1]
MTISDPRTLEAIDEVSRTADRLARRMGGHYVLKVEWQQAIDHLHEQRREGRASQAQVMAQPSALI